METSQMVTSNKISKIGESLTGLLIFLLGGSCPDMPNDSSLLCDVGVADLNNDDKWYRGGIQLLLMMLPNPASLS